MKKVIVFDLGGTLMEYMGMPLSWVEYYQQGFERLNEVFMCMASAQDIETSVKILTSFNPRVNYREVEYSPEYIFSKTLEHWQVNVSMDKCATVFYSGLNLQANIYSDTVPVLKQLHEEGWTISTLTDLPTAMSDELFQKDIKELLPLFDCYVSSQNSGFRKPNCAGLKLIAEKYQIPLETLFFVGDEEKDRKTAEIRIDRKGQQDGDIHSLYELLTELN